MSADNAEAILQAAYANEVEYRKRQFILDSDTKLHIRRIAEYITQELPKCILMITGNPGNGKTTMLYAFRQAYYALVENGYMHEWHDNLRIIDATARRMGITQDKCMINIDRNGNTTAATIPSCLYDYEKELRKGDNLILSAFGGGYTWGAIYVKWAYDGSKACQIDPSEK